MIKAKIGRISYINVAPVYYGLDRGLAPDWLEMVTKPPAVLNKMLVEEKIDLSPVSSAAYAQNSDKWVLLPDISISSFGEVMSVILVSRLPFEELDGKQVSLSEESASAAALVKLLAKKRGIKPLTKVEKIKTPDDISEKSEAALVIGDAALTEKWSGSFQYVYDLGQMWYDETDFPFVYAVWAMRKKFADDNPDTVKKIIRLFRESKDNGKANNKDIVENSSKKTGLPQSVCEKYFKCLNCDLGTDHIDGLKAYYAALFEAGIISVKPEISFYAQE
jgi:chorismate dehydratase